MTGAEHPPEAPSGSAIDETCWLMIRAEDHGSVLWRASGDLWMTEDLPPLPPALLARIAAFGADYDRLDAANETFPEPMYWEQRADFPVAAFNAQGRSLAHALKTALPPDWTVVYEDVDAWLRPERAPIATRQLILPGDAPPPAAKG